MTRVSKITLLNISGYSFSVSNSKGHFLFYLSNKTVGITNTLEDRNKIEKDLDRLEHGAENNRMKCNCNVWQSSTCRGKKIHTVTR